MPGIPVSVGGDGARLQQVVANLLTNAARYSPPGARVELRLQREGDSAVLAVRDWGSGIDAALLPRIFHLFVQSDEASRQPRGGLGIGLALVRRIVELHDGTVEAKSAGRDLGSEFIVRIPCSTRQGSRGQQVDDRSRGRSRVARRDAPPHGCDDDGASARLVTVAFGYC